MNFAEESSRSHFGIFNKFFWLILLALMPFQAYSQSVNDILLSQAKLFSGVHSMGYTVVQGSEQAGNYVKTVWKEEGDKYYCDFIDNNTAGVPFRSTVCYDGVKGYRLSMDGKQMSIKKGPFDECNNVTWSIGPLFAFEFMLAKDERQSVQSIIAPNKIADVLKRATLDSSPLKNIDGHPCIALKIRDAYSHDSPASVSYVVYCAQDLGYFPIAWEMYKSDGSFAYSFCVTKFKTLNIPNSNKAIFLYPESAGITNSHLKQQDNGPFIRPINFPDISINTFNDEDFSIDPSSVNFIEDLDAKKIIAIPH